MSIPLPRVITSGPITLTLDHAEGRSQDRLRREMAEFVAAVQEFLRETRL